MPKRGAMDTLQNTQRLISEVKLHLSRMKDVNFTVNKLTAQSFSPFEYINLDENMSSRILCDLLSPRGAHAQGDLFLRSFLKEFTPLSYNGAVANARCEYSIGSGGRIDVVVKWQDTMLGIENKIGASEQPAQLDRYLDALARHPQFFLLYLTPHGNDASLFSLSDAYKNKYAQQYKNVSWNEVLVWIEAIREKVEAIKLRCFLADFIDCMRSTI